MSAAEDRANTPAAEKPLYTSKQGQFLAFIYYYTLLNGRPPAESDMQRYFSTSPAAVHEMVLALEKRGHIRRTPGQPRSIRLLLPRAALPDLTRTVYSEQPPQPHRA